MERFNYILRGLEVPKGKHGCFSWGGGTYDGTTHASSCVS